MQLMHAHSENEKDNFVSVRPGSTPKFIPEKAFNFRRSTVIRRTASGEEPEPKSSIKDTSEESKTASNTVKEIMMDEKYAMMEEIKETVETETSYIESQLTLAQPPMFGKFSSQNTADFQVLGESGV